MKKLKKTQKSKKKKNTKPTEKKSKELEDKKLNIFTERLNFSRGIFLRKKRLSVVNICHTSFPPKKPHRLNKQVEQGSDFRCVLARNSTHYCTFICSFVLLLLESSSDSHTFLFKTIIYPKSGQKWHFCKISTRV